MKGFASFLKPFDIGALGLALSLTVLSALFIYSGKNGKNSQNRVLITGSGAQWVFPQDRAERINVPGPLGDTLVEVRDNQVRVLASPCGNQTCVAAGAIQAPGQWIACLPNQVLVSIGRKGKTAGTEDELDGAVW